MRDVPMLDEFQRGSIDLFDGQTGHAAEIDGALALSAGAAFHSFFAMRTRVARGPVARSSVEPKMATRGIPMAAARCMAPESFTTSC